MYRSFLTLDYNCCRAAFIICSTVNPSPFLRIASKTFSLADF